MTGDDSRGDDATDASLDDDTEPRPRRRRRLLLLIGTPLILVLLGVGAFAYSTYREVTSSPYKSVTYSLPDAPRLVATPEESVFRIDPSESSLTYQVDERFAGRKVSTAVGTTNGIAGDIAVNVENPSASRAGKIVVNIEQFHSDNRLRDARIRADFLESHAYPLAEFTVSAFEGLPDRLEVGEPVTFTIEGEAKVRDVTRPVTWAAEGELLEHGIELTATTDIALSDFDVDHVSIRGLVSASDDATLTMKLRAVDPVKERIAETITGPDAPEVTGEGPSFSQVVQPILENHCAECHMAGEVGSIHWELTDAQDAAEISEGIQMVTETGYMPPWPASEVGVPLAHKNTLTTTQVKALGDWARNGGALDVPATTPVKPSEGVAERIPRVDKTLLIPTFTGDPKMLNEYRCFVLDPKLTEPTFLSGYGFVADQVPELHHAQVFLISDDQKKNALEMSGEDGRPGWSCFGTVNVRGKPATAGFSDRRDEGFAGQSNLVAGWVPGQTPSSFGEDLGFLMEPGDALVLQIHYHHEGGKANPDRSGLNLQLDPVDGKRKKIRVVNPLAPVEIPCAPDVTAELCDRSASLAENTRNYGKDAAFISNGLLLLCDKTAAGLNESFDGQVAKTECDTTVPESGTIISVLGHMHTIGKTFRLTLEPESSDPTVLLDIPVWNFDWQMNYTLAEPIHVEGGQTIKMECSFDRSLDPNREPRYIMFAEGTEDEMCFGTYALVPDDQSGS